MDIQTAFQIATSVYSTYQKLTNGPEWNQLDPVKAIEWMKFIIKMTDEHDKTVGAQKPVIDPVKPMAQGVFVYAAPMDSDDLAKPLTQDFITFYDVVTDVKKGK